MNGNKYDDMNHSAHIAGETEILIDALSVSMSYSKCVNVFDDCDHDEFCEFTKQSDASEWKYLPIANAGIFKQFTSQKAFKAAL